MKVSEFNTNESKKYSFIDLHYNKIYVVHKEPCGRYSGKLCIKVVTDSGDSLFLPYLIDTPPHMQVFKPDRWEFTDASSNAVIKIENN